MSEAKNALDTWIQNLTGRWTSLAQAGALLITVVGTFAIPPPPGLAGLSDPFLAFGRFLAVLMAGLVFVATRFYGRTRHTKWWVLASMAGLMITTGAFVMDQTESERRMVPCRYGKGTVQFVKGTRYTPEAAEFLKEEPSTDCQLLSSFGYEPRAVWDNDSLAVARRTLIGLYLLLVMGASTSMLAVLQTIECVSGTKKG